MGKGEEGGAGCLKRWGREGGGGIQLKQRTFGWPSHVVNGGTLHWKKVRQWTGS